MSGTQTAAKPDFAKPRKRISWFRMAFRLGSVGLVLVLGAEAGRVLLGSNFHTVVSGMVYRGAQPDLAELENLVSRYHIQTVINLRGTCEPLDWYREESRAVQRLGVSQEDICFSAGRLPSVSEVRRLVEVLDGSVYPVFIHCRRGSDRTGLASAVYLLLKTDATLAQALGQLNFRYGHLALGRTGYLDSFFDLYRAWLAGREHTPALFRHWLLEEYRAGGRSFTVESLVPETESRAGRPCGFSLRVRNTGNITWKMRPGSTAGFRLGIEIRDDQERNLPMKYWGLRDGEVGPGQAIDLRFVVPRFPAPGRYRILIDMVDPTHGWF
jgi:protein tyrosine phosphatase (PTP) superfamily phosphohydrolase (DUF442 family)